MTGSSARTIGFGKAQARTFSRDLLSAGIDDHREAQEEAREEDARRQAEIDEGVRITNAFDMEDPFCPACNVVHPTEGGCYGYVGMPDLIDTVRGGDPLRPVLRDLVTQQRLQS